MSSAPKPGTPFAYAYRQDPESGLSSSSRLARRLITRRSKWLLGGCILVLTIFYLSGPSDNPPGDSRHGGREHQYPIGWTDKSKTGTPERPLGGIWDQEEAATPDPPSKEGWGWGLGLPFGGKGKGSGKPPPLDPLDIHHEEDFIAPLHPDLSKLPQPSTLFSDVSLPSHLKPPTFERFPDERMREVVSVETPDEPVFHSIAMEISEEAFIKSWSGPEDWNDEAGSVQMNQVQWEGFSKGREGWETEPQRRVREERKEAVRRAFAHAWQAYKDHAWGHDEIKPVSKSASNPFNNWGASIVDTLDTLLIMGFSDEYNLCRPHVNQLNFNWVGGRDWSRGFVSEAPATDDDETPAETWAVQRDRGVALPVFETGIRYLGGLLGAYDLSGDQLLVDRAVDLADVLGRAFNTDSGLPAGRIDPGSASGVYRLGTVSIAEVGSMSLELIRLSQITGNRTWFDLAERAMDYLEQKVIPRGDPVIQPLLPLWINPDAGPGSSLNGAFSFGGLADSYYEYLIKTYKLLGGGRVAERWKRIYEQSVTKAQGILFVEVDVVPEHDLLAIGKWEYGRLIPEIEHLTCFAGAMLGLGAKLLDRTKDMVHAERFTQSCYWLSAATHTGLQPESVQFYNGESDKGVMYEHVLKSGKAYHPKTFTPDMVHEYGDGIMRWNVDGQPVKPEEGGEFTDDDEVVAKKLKGTPPGTKVVNGRGINRPETIESIFYMYRLTGDRKWQEKGWKMFVSWVTAARVDGGLSSIADVTKHVEEIRYTDNMESFMFAETLKYHFLLQSEPDVLSLDDYVLNTEAHPLISNRALKPGSGSFWHPPADLTDGLGVRGQGTDAQKWTRLNVLRSKGPGSRNGPGGGGRGMGGGGGYRPG